MKVKHFPDVRRSVLGLAVWTLFALFCVPGSVCLVFVPCLYALCCTLCVLGFVFVCVCVCERERESEFVFTKFLCVCVCVCVCLCVCVCTVNPSCQEASSRTNQS